MNASKLNKKYLKIANQRLKNIGFNRLERAIINLEKLKKEVVQHLKKKSL